MHLPFPFEHSRSDHAGTHLHETTTDAVDPTIPSSTAENNLGCRRRGARIQAADSTNHSRGAGPDGHKWSKAIQWSFGDVDGCPRRVSAPDGLSLSERGLAPLLFWSSSLKTPSLLHDAGVTRRFCCSSLHHGSFLSPVSRLCHHVESLGAIDCPERALLHPAHRPLH